jgi:hypothetical protein
VRRSWQRLNTAKAIKFTPIYRNDKQDTERLIDSGTTSYRVVASNECFRYSIRIANPCGVHLPGPAMRFARLASFDHLVGAGEQSGRHIEAERLGRLEVYHQLEVGRLIDR